MKRYKLIKDLPTFKAGEKFYVNEYTGDLHAENTQGQYELIAYTKGTLAKFPNILTDWFEEIEGEWKPWRAEEGELYWFISGEGWSCEAIEERSHLDDSRWKNSNYFKTRDEAERVSAKLKAYTTVKRDTKGFKDKPNVIRFFIVRNMDGLEIDYRYHMQLGIPSFETEEEAKRSLKKHRKEWELLFDLDEEE